MRTIGFVAAASMLVATSAVAGTMHIKCDVLPKSGRAPAWLKGNLSIDVGGRRVAIDGEVFEITSADGTNIGAEAVSGEAALKFDLRRMEGDISSIGGDYALVNCQK